MLKISEIDKSPVLVAKINAQKRLGRIPNIDFKYLLTAKMAPSFNIEDALAGCLYKTFRYGPIYILFEDFNDAVLFKLKCD